MVLVVRTDLGMGRGKIAAQVAHAAVAATLTQLGEPGLARWLEEGQPKVVLRVVTGDGLEEIARQAAAAGLAVQLVHDAGRTQLAPGTATCCAIGPADEAAIDAVTGELSLL